MTEVSNGAVPPLSFDDLLGRAIHIHDACICQRCGLFRNVEYGGPAIDPGPRPL